MQVSKMAAGLIGSEIIRIGNQVSEQVRQGANICNLTIGDFDSKIFPIPAGLTAGIIAAYQAGMTNYPPAAGMGELRDSVSAFLKTRQDLEYGPNDVLIAGGSRPLIYATYRALVDPGDCVIFPLPSWNNNHYCHLVGATPVAVPTLPENDFMPTAADLAPHVAGATLLALCSPLNPTGTIFTKEGLEEICDLVIAESGSRFVMPFVDLGLVPEAASSLILPRLAGRRRAARYILLGEPFSAEEAAEFGLVSHVAAKGELAATFDKVVASLLAKPAEALRQTQALLRREDTSEILDRMELENGHFSERLGSDEVKQAIAGFFAAKAKASA